MCSSCAAMRTGTGSRRRAMTSRWKSRVRQPCAYRRTNSGASPPPAVASPRDYARRSPRLQKKPLTSAGDGLHILLANCLTAVGLPVLDQLIVVGLRAASDDDVGDAIVQRLRQRESLGEVRHRHLA